MKLRWVINNDNKRTLQIKHDGRLDWDNVPVIHENDIAGNDEKPKFYDNLHFISIEMNR